MECGIEMYNIRLAQSKAIFYLTECFSDLINGIGCIFAGNRNPLHMQKRDSKSFDSGSLYRPDIDDDSNGTSSIERMDRADRSDSKIMLPTPPVRMLPIPNQSHSDNSGSDRNKADSPNIGNSQNDIGTTDTDKKTTEPNTEVGYQHQHQQQSLLPPNNKVDFTYWIFFYCSMIALLLLLFSVHSFRFVAIYSI